MTAPARPPACSVRQAHAATQSSRPTTSLSPERLTLKPSLVAHHAGAILSHAHAIGLAQVGAGPLANVRATALTRAGAGRRLAHATHARLPSRVRRDAAPPRT